MAVAARGHVQAGEAFLSSQPSIAAQLREGGHVAIESELARLDIVQGLDGMPAYQELRSRAIETEVLGITVAVCAFEDLRRMKRAAGRGQDLVDLESLDAIEEET